MKIRDLFDRSQGLLPPPTINNHLTSTDFLRHFSYSCF